MAEWGDNGPVRLMNFRDWVPDALRPWLYILFLTVFQFSNGFYFTTMAQLSGEHSMTMTDMHMFGQTVLIGLTFYFPLAFKLKFTFTNRTLLTTAAVGLGLINAVFPHVHSYVIALILCYLGGFFRLMGTFECFSNLLPKITPTYNYAVFLSFVFFVVLACVQVFDWAAIQIIYYFDWTHIHTLAIALCLLVIVVVSVTMRHFRPAPKNPLFGVDGIGMLVWSVFILSAIYAALYGEQYDWLNDPRIRTAIGICILCLAAGLLRMRYTRHAFIEQGAFTCPNLFNMLVVFFCLDILLGTQNVLQNTFTGGVMGYSQITSAQLKWPEFIGGLVGALFFLLTRIRLGWRLRTLSILSMGAVVLYNLLMAAIISPDINIGRLWLPSAVLGFGHVGIFIALTVYAQANCNFKYYFQILCLLGFIRTGLGDAVGIAFWERALTGSVNVHIAGIGAAADLSSLADLYSGKLAASVSAQALLSALRELYGWAVVFGVGVLILMLASFVLPSRFPLPRIKSAYEPIRRFIRRYSASRSA